MIRLQQLRLDAGMTLAEVGLAVGVSKQALSVIENGAGARPATLKALGDYFNVQPTTLLEPVERSAA